MSSSITPRVHEIVDRLSVGMVERDQMLRVALLGTIAGENVLLLGPPGTAKSLLARRMSGVISSVHYFQYMLTRFTSPDELFGPVSLRTLKENDEFRRKIEGYLPTAEVAFIDEIFKANSAILNSLLSLLNERLYFNGGQVVRSPLLALIAASNEVPVEDELAALFDRFTVRLSVAPIVDEENVLQMLRYPEPPVDWNMPETLRLTTTDVQRARQDARDVTLSPGAERVILRVKRQLEAHAAADAQAQLRFYISDRRWRQAVRLLRMSAWLNGREQVTAVDCALLRHCLWNQVSDEPTVLQALENAFEDANATFGLDLNSFIQRWMRLLSDMRDREGLAQPLYNGWLVSHSGQKFFMTDLRAADAMTNTWEVVRSTGLWYDANGRRFRKVRLRGDGSVVVNVGFGAQAVGDAGTWRSLVGAGHSPQLEDAEVAVERRVSPGMSLDFSVAPGALREMYRREAGRVMAMLDEIESDRRAALEDLDVQLRDHLFVPVHDARALRAGLLRVELTVQEWRVKVEMLADALDRGAPWETADLDVSARAEGLRADGADRA